MLETESNQIHIKVAVSLHKIVVSYIRGMGRIFRISTALKSVPSLPKHMWLNARKGETIIEFNVGCAPPQGWPSQYGFKPNNVEHALSAATNGQFTEDGVQFYIDPDLMKECLRHKDKWGNVNVGGVIIEELDKEQIQIPDGADAEMRINIFRTQAQREQDNELAASANTAYKNYFEHIPIPQD
jgi:hypothetical protein